MLSAPTGGWISGQAALIDLAGWTAPELVARSPLAMMVRFPEHSGLAAQRIEELKEHDLLAPSDHWLNFGPRSSHFWGRAPPFSA